MIAAYGCALLAVIPSLVLLGLLALLNWPARNAEKRERVEYYDLGATP